MTGEITLVIHDAVKGDADVKLPFTVRSREDLPFMLHEAARLLEEALTKLEDES